MKRTVILMSVLVLVILAAAGGAYYYRFNSGDRLLSRARLALRANKPAKAHELAAKYIRNHPEDWQGYYEQSRAYGAETRFPEAHASLELAANAGAGTELVTIFRADLFVAEGQVALTSQEAAELHNAVAKLAEALDLLDELDPAAESVAVDVAFRVAMAQRSSAAANGRLAVVLQRRSLRIRASRSAPPLLEQWNEVFSSLAPERRARLMATLAETLAFEGSVEADVALIGEAATILADLLAAPVTDEALRQQAWVVAASVALLEADLEAKGAKPSSGEWLDRADQLCQQALAADANDWQAMHLQSQVAFRQAEAAMAAARRAVLDVIAQDPSRSKAATMAVRLCLSANDREGLASARASLEPLADVPIAASLMLIRHELRLAAEQQPPGPTYRELVAATAPTLAQIAAAHPADAGVALLQADVAVRRLRYDDAAAFIAEALRIDPRGPGAGHARLLQARIALATEGAKAVEDELTQLRADYPNAPEVQYTYALAMISLGRTDLAGDAYRSMTKLGAGRPLVPAIPGPDAELNRAETALRLSDPASAKEICDRVIIKAKSPTGAFHARGWLLRAWAQSQSEPDSAQRLVQFVVQANNTDYADDAAGAVDDVLAMATDALRQAGAEAPGPQGPTPRASGLFSAAMRLLPTVYGCRRILSDGPGAEEVIDLIAGAPRLSGRHQAALAGVLIELERTAAAERLLRAELAEHADDATELVYARLVDLYLGQGLVEKALGELDAMLAAADSSDVAQLRKAQILAAIDRKAEADAIATTLTTKAVQTADVPMLQQLTTYYSRTLQAGKTIQMLDELARIRTPVAADHIVGASALAAAGRYDEAVAMYRRAIGLERDELRIPAMYRDLARLLDADYRRSDALAVLAELRSLPGPESRRQIYQAESVFHEGSLMLRWGLYGQAAERFVGLAAGEQEGSAAGRLALGRALAGLGETDRASRVLSTIPPGNSQYLSAQLLRISLAPDTADRIKLLRRLGRIAPTHEGILVELMRLLHQEGMADEAVELYRAFAARQGLAYQPRLLEAGQSESRAPILALYMLWQSGQRTEAAREASRLSELTGTQLWQVRAALLTIVTDPAAAAAMLEPLWAAAQGRSGPEARISGVVALTGVSAAALAGEGEAAATWLARVDTSGQADPEARLLAALAVAGDTSAERRLGEVQAAGGGVNAPAAELVAAVAADEAVRAETATLLAASVAAQAAMPWMTRSLTTEALEARPQSQWAALLLHTYREDLDESRLVARLLQPPDCMVGRMVKADLLAADGKMAEAAELYKSIAEETGEVAARMQYALALEQAGRTVEAIAEYVALWQSDQSSVAANNAAYRMQVVYGDDVTKLAEAHRLAAEAVRLSPSQGAFRDTLGWIAYQRGHHETAARELVQALRQMPNSPTVHYHVAVAEAAVGNRQLALWHLQTASLLVDRLAATGRSVGAEDQDAARLASEMLSRMTATE